jgi:NADH-quinone oxidoreductase subunit H
MDWLIEVVEHPFFWPVVFGVVIVGLLPLVAGYMVLLERKLMADIHVRLGPMRVGPHGLLQPIADAVKLLLKEDIIPDKADRLLFWTAPLISVGAAFIALAAIPFGPGFQIADLNVGLLFIIAVASLGIFGIVLGGWSSNSNYALLGALRSAAQVISYETAVGLALVSGLLVAGSLSMRAIVEAQASQGVWFVFLVPLGFFIYLVAGIAELNRAPFDLPEAESELVAGYMTEYSGFRWAIFFLAEYTAMLVVAGIGTTLFLGGWLRPFPNVAALNFLDFVPALFFLVLAAYCGWRTPKQPLPIQKAVMALFGLICLALAAAVGGAALLPAESAARAGILGGFWFLLKAVLIVYLLIWLRFTFPRYRFDQLMRLGWHFLIPVSLVNVMAVGAGLVLHWQRGWPLWLALGLGVVATILVGAWLLAIERRRTWRPAEGD